MSKEAYSGDLEQEEETVVFHTIAKGDRGVLVAANRFAELGYQIFFPLCAGLPFDLVVLKNGVFSRVQVKASHSKSGSLRIELSSRGRGPSKRYSSKEIDALVCVDLVTSAVYFLNYRSKEYDDKTTFFLRTRPAKNNQSQNVKLAKDYKL